MIIAFALENLIWKRNKLKPLVSLVGSAIWRFVFVMSACLVVFAIIGLDIFDGINPTVVGMTFLLHVFGVSAVLLWVKTMQNMCISVADPLSLFRIIPLTIASWLIFGGTLTYVQVALVVGIFVFCASLGFAQGYHENKQKKICCDIQKHTGDFKKGTLFLLMWCVCVVAMSLIINYMTYMKVNPFGFSALRAVTFLISAFVVFMIFKRGEKLSSVKSAFLDKNMMMIGAAFAVGSLLFIVLLGYFDNVGILEAIGVASVTIVVLCGTLFMKEKLKWYSFILIGLILACVAVLSIITV